MPDTRPQPGAPLGAASAPDEPAPSLLRRAVRRVVPLPLRRTIGRARARHREATAERRQLRLLRHELRAIAALPAGAPIPDAALDRLLAIWANGGWPAGRALLAEWALRLRALPRGAVVLECGSGLTTLLAAAIVRRTGVEVHTLEQHPAWADRVRRGVRALRAPGVHVHGVPLRDYGPHDWYTLPPGFPDHFDLVLCDGPPGRTRGGRAGCIPVLESRARPGTVLIVDDVQRDTERYMVEHWQATGWAVDGAVAPDARHATLRRM